MSEKQFNHERKYIRISTYEFLLVHSKLLYLEFLLMRNYSLTMSKMVSAILHTQYLEEENKEQYCNTPLKIYYILFSLLFLFFSDFPIHV
jgi:hypothetical protein